MTAPPAPTSTGSVFDLLRVRLGLEVRRRRPADPFPWGTEKVRPRREALEAGLAATQAKMQAEVRGFRRRMRALALDRERYAINLAELDAFVAERRVRSAASPTTGVPVTVASRRRRPASVSSPSAGKVAAATDAIAYEAEVETTVAGQAIGRTLPITVVDPGDGDVDDGTLLGDEEAEYDPDADDALEADLEAWLPPVEACAPGWSNVDNPPMVVKESFPFAGCRIGRLDALTADELRTLVGRLPPEDRLTVSVGEHGLEPEHSDAESGDRVRRCRAALERGITRETHRRMLWRSLLLRQRIIMASDPERPNAPAPLAEARQVIALIDHDAQSQLTEAQVEVRQALIDLLPSPAWLSSADDRLAHARTLMPP